MPWYETDGGDRLWYEEQGEGPTLILLHGWCMSSAVFRIQLDELATSFRVLAPDLAGHGRSNRSAGGYGFEKYSRDLASLVQTLQLSDLLLAGWSLGAQVAIQALPLLRERVAGLVLIAGTPRFTSSSDFPYALSRMEADGMGLKVRRNIGRALEGFIGRMFAPGELDDPLLADRVRGLLADVPIPDTDCALQSLQALSAADMRGLIERIDLPTLVINGDQDRICLPQASAWMADHITASRRISFSGCGHAPFMTRSREFNACLIDFGRRVREQSS